MSTHSQWTVYTVPVVETMVTVLNRRQHGYDVRIYTSDHGPPHVHVSKGERRVRIGLRDLRPTRNQGFTNREIKRIRQLIQANMELIMSEWTRLHNDD